MIGILHPLTAALTLASPAGRRAKLAILIYHRVLPAPDPLQPDTPDARWFDWQMSWLARHCHVLPLAEAGRLLRDGRLPARAACVTFDDGYADNYTVALPILRRYRLPATFFVATGFLDGGRMFNDTLIELVRRLPDGRCDLRPLGLGMPACAAVADRRALIKTLIGHFKYQPLEERRNAVEALAAAHGVRLPNDLMLRTDELRALHDSEGVEIGGHTHHHPILARLETGPARDEIARGKAELEARIGAPIRLFAYPNGRPGQDYRNEHVAMVRECGFELAVSTTPAAASRRSDPYQLPRFTPWDRTPGRFALRMVRTLARST